MSMDMVPHDEAASPSDTSEELAALAKEVADGFVRVVTRPDVRRCLHAFATRYDVDPLAAAAIARVGFIATVMAGRMNGDEDDAIDTPHVTDIFLRGVRLLGSRRVNEMLSAPDAPKPSEMTGAFIELLSGHPELLASSDRQQVWTM